MNEWYKIRERYQEKIDNIMDNFDFERVYGVMKFLTWKWAFSDNGVPEIYELREFAREQLYELINRYMRAKIKGDKNSDFMFISCGGFTSMIAFDTLQLTFNLDSWEEELNEV